MPWCVRPSLGNDDGIGNAAARIRVLYADAQVGTGIHQVDVRALSGARSIVAVTNSPLRGWPLTDTTESARKPVPEIWSSSRAAPLLAVFATVLVTVGAPAAGAAGDSPAARHCQQVRPREHARVCENVPQLADAGSANGIPTPSITDTKV